MRLDDRIPRPPWSLGLQMSGQLTMWYYYLSPSLAQNNLDWYLATS